MTYDKSNSESDGYRGFDGPRGHGWSRGPQWGGDPLGWAKQSGFHPLKAVAVVAGFALFPPLGVLTLGYFLWNSRRHAWCHGGSAYSGGIGMMGRCDGRVAGADLSLATKPLTNTRWSRSTSCVKNVMPSKNIALNKAESVIRRLMKPSAKRKLISLPTMSQQLRTKQIP